MGVVDGVARDRLRARHAARGIVGPRETGEVGVAEPLREAGQNLWDARIREPGASPPRMLVRVRTLGNDEHEAFRNALSNGDARSAEPLSGDTLRRHLSLVANVRTLEICDFGTVGLNGGSDPTSEQGNFVRFFFDIGTPHVGGGDGGTYGYGRSSLYLAGAARTILVDTQVHGERTPRRLMACRLGPAYVKSRLGGSHDRYTGRHFWGGQVEGSAVRPMEGDGARLLSAALGMPARSIADSGTSILIPWPDLPTVDTDRHIVGILLHNLWPISPPIFSTTRFRSISSPKNPRFGAINPGCS